MPSNPLIVGDLAAADELMHEVTADPSFNESMMFNFFDTTHALGGFVRIGNRVNEGHAEMTFCVFLPGGELLIQWQKPPIHSNQSFDAAGLKFSVLEAVRHLQVTYQGQAVRIADPYQMKAPGRALRENPSVPVEMRLDIRNTGPMIGSASGDPSAAVIFLNGVGHYQQPLSAHGTLKVGGQTWNLSMFGVRDHSWGRRVWSSILRDRSIWINFGPDLAFICCKTWLSSNSPPDIMGCVIEGNSVTPLRIINLTSQFRPDMYYHESVQMDLIDARGRRYLIGGEVLSYVPLRHRKPGQETVYLGQALTRFTLAGRTSLGLSEYFDAESECPALLELSRRSVAARE
jgi:hypothetical protein